jgi:hypothetical protein
VGRALRGSVQRGFFQAPDIGPDFAQDLQGLAPQPSGCSF